MILDSIQSVVRPSFYRSVHSKSFRATVGYFTYLGFIFGFAATLAMYIHVRPLIAEAVAWASSQIPTLTLADGKLACGVPGPTLIRHPKIQEAAFIIDTQRTQPVSAGEMVEKKVIAYLTQSTIYVLTQRRMEVYDLSKAKQPKPLTLDAEFFRQLGVSLNRILYPIAFVSTWIAFLVWRHFATVFYTLPGLLINALSSASLDYPTVYKIAVYAQTPAIVLQAAAMVMSVRIPWFGLLTILVVCGYLFMGVSQQKQAREAGEI